MEASLRNLAEYDISIHALRKESDISTPVNSSRKYDFNPRSP